MREIVAKTNKYYLPANIFCNIVLLIDPHQANIVFLLPVKVGLRWGWSGTNKTSRFVFGRIMGAMLDGLFVFVNLFHGFGHSLPKAKHGVITLPSFY